MTLGYSGVDLGPATVYAAAAQKVGLRVVAEPQGVDPEGVDPLSRDFPSLAQKIRQSGADVVYFGTDTVTFGGQDQMAGRLWQQLRVTLGNNVRLMGTNGIFNQAFIDAAASAAEGTYAVSANLPPGKLSGAGAQWYANYKARFNAEPGGYAVYGYEAMNEAHNAVRERMAANRRKSAGHSWEIYGDPTPDPPTLRRRSCTS